MRGASTLSSRAAASRAERSGQSRRQRPAAGCWGSLAQTVIPWMEAAAGSRQRWQLLQARACSPTRRI